MRFLVLLSIMLFASGVALADVAPPPDPCQHKKVGDSCSTVVASGTCQASDAGSQLYCRSSAATDGGPTKPKDDPGGCALSAELPTTSVAAFVIGLWLVIRLRRKPKGS